MHRRGICSDSKADLLTLRFCPFITTNMTQTGILQSWCPASKEIFSWRWVLANSGSVRICTGREDWRWYLGAQETRLGVKDWESMPRAVHDLEELHAGGGAIVNDCRQGRVARRGLEEPQAGQWTLSSRGPCS